eukprot:139519_1
MIILLLITSLLTSALATDNYGPWIEPTYPTLPQPSMETIAGYSSSFNTIWLLAGWKYQGGYSRKVIAFNTIDKTFTEHPQLNISALSYPHTQINQYIYSMDIDSRYFHRFNVDDATELYMNNLPQIYQTSQQYGSSCLSSIDQGNGYLLVAGGYKYGALSDFAVFDLGTNTWFSNMPFMNNQRYFHNCIVHNNHQLYAIGGVQQNSIEVLDVSNPTNIQNQQWQLLANTFPYTGMWWTSLVVDGSKVVIFGGKYSDGYRGDIHVIDTLTNTMSVSGNLGISMSATAAISVGPVIYAFGGQNGDPSVPYPDYVMDSWRYFTLPPTYSPTFETISPTSLPSIPPTNNPSDDPTYSPSTYSPSNSPSPSPTYLPTPTPTGFANYFTYNNYREAQAIICPDDANCIVSCNVLGSCYQATLLCPKDHKCYIHCTSGIGCESIHINCTESAECNIYCTQDGSCIQSVIDCPLNGDCNIHAQGSYSLYGASINSDYAAVVRNGNLVVDMISPEASVCSKQLEFGKVWCPNYGNCTFRAAGSHSFNYAEIYAQEHTNLLHIYGKDTETCNHYMFYYSKIHCPWSLTPGYENNCVIEYHHTQAYRFYASKMEIWAVESLNDVKIICDSDNIIQCLAYITMHCTEDYSETCTLQPLGTPGNYQCEDTNSKCHNYQITLAPTRAPTLDCKTMKITVIDANGFDAGDFDGLYVLDSSLQFNRPMWILTQPSHDQTVEYSGSGWLIHGTGNAKLSHDSNTYFPPENTANAQWQHSSIQREIFHVMIECSDSLSPTSIPTTIPTGSPTNNPSTSPTTIPTGSPTNNPSDVPTNSPSKTPSNEPSSSPTFNPSRYPTVPPTTSPTQNPTKFPTNNPTSNPSQYPTSNPSQYPTSNPTKYPANSPTLFPTNNPTKPPSKT